MFSIAHQNVHVADVVWHLIKAEDARQSIERVVIVVAPVTKQMDVNITIEQLETVQSVKRKGKYALIAFLLMNSQTLQTFKMPNKIIIRDKMLKF